MSHRVQIPAYTDRWMMGDRYGDVIGFSKPKNWLDPKDPRGLTIARVKLDKSGKTVRVIYDDCTPV